MRDYLILRSAINTDPILSLYCQVGGQLSSLYVQSRIYCIKVPIAGRD